jgi:hypothetical protein
MESKELFKLKMESIRIIPTKVYRNDKAENIDRNVVELREVEKQLKDKFIFSEEDLRNFLISSAYKTREIEYNFFEKKENIDQELPNFDIAKQILEDYKKFYKDGGHLKIGIKSF